MKVKELIKILEGVDQELPVVFSETDYHTLTSSNRIVSDAEIKRGSYLDIFKVKEGTFLQIT